MDKSDFFPYQGKAIEFTLEHPNAMLWLDMGLGKTGVTLTAIEDLQDRGLISSALVVAPKRIIQSVWRQEGKKWEHLNRLRFSLIHGTATQRSTALRRRADVYLVNYENLRWLAAQVEHLWLRKGSYPPFSMLVLDEVTRVKNSQAHRSKALSKLLPYFSRRVGLTGEPAANGYKDLYGQYLVIDEGQRLGTTLGSFRERFLRATGYGQYSWAATKTGRDQIHKRISDITLEMSAKDYLDLPPVTTNVILVDLPPEARSIYDLLEKEFFAELDSGAELEVVNEASKINKLAQIASGAAYLSVGGPWEEVHTAKMDALQSIVEESSGRPLLLGYGYVHEASRIAQAFPEKPQDAQGASFLSSKLTERELNEVLGRWERDEVPLLCGHPASMGHGLNLQGASARAVVWFSLPWSLELYNQMNARLIGGHRRQGATVIHHIVARDTVDEVIWSALAAKSTTQASLKAAVTAYRKRKH